jgi:hypothetical protein
MRWVRQNIRMGAGWALFALAIQFVVLFGHAHPVGTAGHADVASLSALGLEAPASAAVPQAPADPSKPGGLAFDYCAICAVINLAGAMMPTTAPTSLPPTAVGPVRFWVSVDNIAAALPHRLFQARAPPLV